MNYLSHLVARTLNRLPVVQPRLPSRFEAARRPSIDDAPAPLESATFTTGRPSIKAGTAAFTSTAVTQKTAPTRSAQPADREPAATLRPPVDDPPARTRPVPQKETFYPEKIEREVPPPKTREIRHRTVNQFIERAAETIVTHHTVMDYTATIEQLALMEGDRTEPPAVIAAPEATAPYRPPKVAPFVPPPAEGAPAPGPESAATVHVSIGRIEVRAVPDARPTSAPVPESGMPKHQLLSLDDYLRGVRK